MLENLKYSIISTIELYQSSWKKYYSLSLLLNVIYYAICFFLMLGLISMYKNNVLDGFPFSIQSLTFGISTLMQGLVYLTCGMFAVFILNNILSTEEQPEKYNIDDFIRSLKGYRFIYFIILVIGIFFLLIFENVSLTEFEVGGTNKQFINLYLYQFLILLVLAFAPISVISYYEGTLTLDIIKSYMQGIIISVALLFCIISINTIVAIFGIINLFGAIGFVTKDFIGMTGFIAAAVIAVITAFFTLALACAALFPIKYIADKSVTDEVQEIPAAEQPEEEQTQPEVSDEVTEPGNEIVDAD